MTSRSKPKPRTLEISQKVHDIPVRGRCSQCRRPFEVRLIEHERLEPAKMGLQAMFDAHVCDEDANQAAARIVRETTQDQ